MGRERGRERERKRSGACVERLGRAKEEQGKHYERGAREVKNKLSLFSWKSLSLFRTRKARDHRCHCYLAAIYNSKKGRGEGVIVIGATEISLGKKQGSFFFFLNRKE